ncbi:hypothetical protein [Bartonella apihabitans]|uniref:hypothetical protein n=1 Tax=Bartonella apihabitans TaxID=2750929 RepID=UPI003BB4BF18
MTRMFDPAVATLCSALIAAGVSVISMLFNFFTNSKSEKIRLGLDENNMIIRHFSAVTNEQITREFNDIKKQEIERADRWQFATVLLKRHDGLREAIAELLTILDQNYDCDKPVKDEILERFRLQKNMISLYFPPRGPFAEELNIQMAHIEVSLSTGKKLSDNFSSHFGAAFHMNCWSLLNAEFDRIMKLIEPETNIQLDLPKPYKATYKHG